QQPPAQSGAPSGRVDQEPAQLRLPRRGPDNGNATDDPPATLRDPEPIPLRPRADELRQRAGDVGLEGGIEAALPGVNNPGERDREREGRGAKMEPEVEARRYLGGPFRGR